jgi:dihydrofolate synthase/folylpolyglutamate synthase
VNYQQTLDYLNHLGHEFLSAHYGLEKVSRLLGEINNPHTAYPSIIIAGTNGKGSVAAMIDAILRRAGLRTGLYTSPHLVSIRERIKVAGQEISPEAFAAHATRVLETAEHLRARGEIASLPTYFEHVTATGFSYFREQAIDLAVLEVGLGGRLDATNIVQPLVAVITAIDFDHEHILGSTLAAIAAEKAAVIKPGALAVTSRQQPEAAQVILRRCQECRVTPVIAWGEVGRLRIQDITPDGRFTFGFRGSEGVYENVRLTLRGYHQLENAAVAIEAAEALRRCGFSIPSEAISDGLETVQWPGRLELLPSAPGPQPSALGLSPRPSALGPRPSAGPTILLDGAHNLAGAKTLRWYLTDFGRRPLTLIFGAMRDKRIEEMADELFPLAETVILTRVQDERAADHERLRRLAAYPNVILTETVSEALDRGLNLTPPGGLICVTGSLYLVGAVKQWWQPDSEPAPLAQASAGAS